MFAFLIRDLANLDYYLSHPWLLLLIGFQIWMLVDAVRREEWLWAVLIFLFSALTAIFYYFFVYRTAPALSGGGRKFELPGSQDRCRIKELEQQIHHLDKAHHHLQLGDIYMNQGNLDKAEACYRAALERDPEDLDIRSHLGQCLLRRKRVDEAKPLLESVCAEDPRHEYGQTLMALADAHAESGEIDRAVAALQKVLETNSYTQAKVRLAELHLQRNQHESARPLLQEVLDDDAHAPAFQRKRDRDWVKKAKALLRQ